MAINSRISPLSPAVTPDQNQYKPTLLLEEPFPLLGNLPFAVYANFTRRNLSTSLQTVSGRL